MWRSVVRQRRNFSEASTSFQRVCKASIATDFLGKISLEGNHTHGLLFRESRHFGNGLTGFHGPIPLIPKRVLHEASLAAGHQEFPVRVCKYSTVSIVKNVTQLKLRDNEDVRLVQDNKEHEVITYKEAKKIAEYIGADLILVSASAKPPVFKLGAGQQILLESRNRQKAARKKELEIKRAQIIKEVRIGVQAAPHDLNRQIKIVQGFIEKGNKVRVIIPHKRIQEKFVPDQIKRVKESCSAFSELINPNNAPRATLGSKVLMFQPLASREKLG